MALVATVGPRAVGIGRYQPGVHAVGDAAERVRDRPYVRQGRHFSAVSGNPGDDPLPEVNDATVLVPDEPVVAEMAGADQAPEGQGRIGDRVSAVER